MLIIFMMKNSVIFASSIHEMMSDYRIHLDEDLVVEVKKMFGTEESFQTWLQSRVEQWLRERHNDDADIELSHGGLSDEELAEKLKGFPLLTMESFPELSESEFVDMVKSQAGRIPDGLEEWL